MSLCYNCFNEYEGYGACPYCGYDETGEREKYPHALPHGTILAGSYITGRVLGQGGFGITYVAKEHKTGSRVAIKEFYPEAISTRGASNTIVPFSGQRAEDFEYGKRSFLEEATALAKFNENPHIVSVYSYFEENGTAYFAMEFLEGKSLQTYIKESGGRISCEEAERLLLPIMTALEEVHSTGIIHRDIKPDNIMLTADGQAKLLDFGSARYSMGEKSRSLDVVLTHGFSPREQYSRHGRQGAYTDVYALAATYYYAVTGRVPPDSIDRADDDDIIFPSSLGVSITQEKEDALLKALAVKVPDRFQTVRDFREAFLGNDTIPEPVSINNDNNSGNNMVNFVPGNSYNGNNVPGNSYNGNNVPGNSYNGNNVPGNSYNGNNVPGNSYSGNNVPGNSYNGNNVPGNSYNGNNVPGNSYNGNNVPGNSYNGNNVPGNSYNGNNVPGNSYNGNNVPGNSYNGNNVPGNSIKKNTASIPKWLIPSAAGLIVVLVVVLAFVLGMNSGGNIGTKEPDASDTGKATTTETAGQIVSDNEPQVYDNKPQVSDNNAVPSDTTTTINIDDVNIIRDGSGTTEKTSMTEVSQNQVKIVDVSGKTINTASRELENIGLKYTVSWIYNPTFERDHVIKTVPAANETVPEGTTVTIYVSLGEKETTAATSYVSVNPYKLYSIGEVKVRSGPGSDQNVLGSVARGEEVIVVGTTGDWYAISWHGTTAYVMQQYFSANPPPAETTAATTTTTTAAPTPASDDSVKSEYEYREDGGKIVLTKYVGTAKNITIPTKINGKTVVIERGTFSGNTTIESVVIPEAFTELPERAFKECTNLKKATIKGKVVTIPYGLFYYCGELTEVVLPSTVKVIDTRAFNNCKKLSKINMPSSLQTINQSAFFYCESLTTVELPNGFKTIGDDAFCLCKGITKMTLPSTVTSIGECAFGWNNFTEIYVPDGVTVIEKETFEYCKSLKNISLPKKCSVADDAFKSCNNVKITYR